jgi:hypothetical protein
MEKRIKIFIDQWVFDLEECVNSFLEETDGRMHELHVMERTGGDYLAILGYTPNEEKSNAASKRQK